MQTMYAMQSDILTLTEQVARLTGWTEKTIGAYFGNAYAPERVRNGRAELATCIEFKAWLEAALGHAKIHGSDSLKKHLRNTHNLRLKNGGEPGDQAQTGREMSTPKIDKRGNPA